MMNRKLGLHHMTAMSLDPFSFVAAAAEAGCDAVSLFTYAPDFVLPGIGAVLNFPVLATQDKQRFLRLLADSGVSVSGVEFFPIVPDRGITDYLPALALGAELGATRTVTHIHETDTARATDLYGALCDMAAEEGLAVAIEYTPLTQGCQSIEQAQWFVDQVGRANAGIAVDCLHVVRSGGSAQGIAELDPRYFIYAQICDGHGLHRSADYLAETGDRGIPGEGDFPLAEILAALPASLPLEVEVPCMMMDGQPLYHLRRTLEQSQALVDSVITVR